ncbi:MAG: hypothetical protein NWE92_11060 [Candidatus Bathyarchaeota archaeon]|nr:hypothetical protein [Candidatus Bathyarchaeota archaeon]
MKKLIVSLGALILIIGVLLVASPIIFTSTISSPYVPDSACVINDNFPIPLSPNVTLQASLNEGDLMGISALIFSEADPTFDLSIRSGSTTYLTFSGVNAVDKNWTVPVSQNYDFIYTSDSTDTGFISTWVYRSNEVAYRDVTVVNPLISQFSSSIVFVAISFGILVVGVVLVIVGFVKGKPPKS